jgi:phosphate-selective porin
MKKIILATLVLLFFIASNSKSQTSNDILNLLIQRNLITQEEADSLRSEDAIKQQDNEAKRKSFGITASKLFQLDGYTNIRYQVNDEHGKIDGFDIRRVYLGFRGTLSPYWSYRFQADFAATPKIVDAYIEYKLNDYLNFTLGQFILPFSLESVTSNLKLDFIDRSQVVEALVARGKDVIGNYNGRDIGVQVGGTLLKLNEKPLVEYKIGLFNGSGTNQTDKNESKDLVSRICINPIKGLSFGASYYNGVGNFGTPAVNRKRERFGLEARYDYLNFSLRGEYIKGTDRVTKREGYYLQAGYYMIPQKLQLVAKLDAYDPDTATEDNASTWYIGGINYTFNPNIRLLANYTVKTEQSGDYNNNLASVQLQVSF